MSKTEVLLPVKTVNIKKLKSRCPLIVFDFRLGAFACGDHLKGLHIRWTSTLDRVKKVTHVPTDPQNNGQTNKEIQYRDFYILHTMA